MRREGAAHPLPAIALLLAILVLALIHTAGCAKKPEPPIEETIPEARPYRPVLNSFYTNGRGPGASYESLSGHRQWIDEISPLWHHLGGDGNLTEEVDRESLKMAGESGIKVLPLVALHPGGGKVLLNQAAGERAASNIARAVLENNYDGINIDLEIIKSARSDYGAEKEGLTGLVASLAEKLRPHGKRLDVSVVPPVQPPSHLATVYDYRQLAGLADRIVLMAYDHHHPGSLPGPVAPLPWVEENINALLAEGISPEKISLGVAAYGYDWPSGKSGGRARPSAEILHSAKSKGLAVQWDLQRQSPYLKYESAGGEHREVWFESGEAAAAKIQLVKKYRLAGISVWRLGYEDQALWEAVQK